MTVATVASRALAGIDAPEVTVEVHLGPGLPAFHIVGLPDAEVREARDRVRAALNHGHFEFPARRITVNLAPAELPKDSSRFDLPIAIGILAASGQLAPQALAGQEFAGELSLTGELRPVRGALAGACVRSAGRQCASGGACTRRAHSAGEIAPRGGGASRRRSEAGGVLWRYTGGRWQLSGFQRCEGTAAGKARARGRGSRRAQRLDDRPARHRQVHA